MHAIKPMFCYILHSFMLCLYGETKNFAMKILKFTMQMQLTQRMVHCGAGK